MRTVRVDGHCLEVGDDDEIEVPKSNRANPHLVAEHKGAGKGMTLAERKLYRADIRHPPVGAVGQRHLPLFDFHELQLGSQRWRDAQNVGSRIDQGANILGR